jgi:MFS family permease
MLQIMILWYAAFTFLCGFAQNFEQLFILRALHGFGFGGEWSAGAVLMGEAIRDKYRGRAVGIVQTGWAIGWGVAALLYTSLYAVLPGAVAWHVLFWIGILPAFFVFWVRRHLEEPALYQATRTRGKRAGKRAGPGQLLAIFGRPHQATTIKCALMCTGALGGGYALSLWLPTYLKLSRGLSAPDTGGFLLLHIFGALLGFLIGTYMSDAIGRRWTFMISAIASFVLVLVYMFVPMSNFALLALGFPLGVALYMKFPPMGPFLTELYPTEVRGTGQGFCYNAGRGFGAIFPTLVGLAATELEMPLAAAIGLFCALAFGLMIVMLLMLPETHGSRIAELDGAAHPERTPLAGLR